MLYYKRILFVLAIAIELIAVLLWVFGEKTSILNFLLIIFSMVLLQISLLVNSKFKLWKAKDGYI